MAQSVVTAEPVLSVKAARWVLIALVLLFFLSGISGLIYQVLWLRLLSQVFGVTVHAATTVLTSFMAGLALGSYAAGRLADRTRSPLLWFGLAEVLVGTAALLTPLALDGVESLYLSLYPSFESSLTMLTAIRFVLSFAVLIVPTTLMGATLPLVIKSSLLRHAGLGARAGLLYATNTAGAVGGALLAGFYLIGGIGVSASFKFAAAINATVGISAAVASLAIRRTGVAEPAISPPPVSPDAAGDLRSTPESTRKLVLIIFALSGFISLALEIVWFRVLVLFLQVTTYAFTIMLATVLCGIAVGSYLITPLMRRRANWVIVLGLVEVLLGVTALGTLAFLSNAYDVARLSEPVLSRIFGDRELLMMVVASFLAIFPATLLMGIAFPIGLQVWAGDDDGSDEAGGKVGIFYSVNVAGAILGSVIAGFLLLPKLGTRGSLMALTALGLASGVALLFTLPRFQRVISYGGSLIGLFAFVLIGAGLPEIYSVALANRYSGEELIWREEGVQTTASVHAAGAARILYLDGLHQASDGRGVVQLHRLIGHLPMLLHDDPRTALVIGLGGGVTPGAVSQHSNTATDVVELSQTVIDAARWFRHVNNDVHNRPNVRLIVGDGRNYLLTTPKRYDVITADIIRPHHAGAGNLYSAEYFRLARNALNDDGLMLQWLNRESEVQYTLIMRTFLSVFPDATLWHRGTLMVGSKHPLRIDRASFQRRASQPGGREILESIGLTDFDSLLSLFTAGPETMREFAGPGPILTDDRPVTEYFHSLPRSQRQQKLDNSTTGDVDRFVQ
jgi:spermidine synthase